MTSSLFSCGCCAEMRLFRGVRYNFVEYEPKFREYSIPVTSGVSQEIAFCPWCGQAFLGSLRDIFFDVVEIELDLTVDIGELSSLPSEFLSEEWWSRRGLQQLKTIDREGSEVLYKAHGLKNADFCCEAINFHIHEKEGLVVYEKPLRRFLLQTQRWRTQEIFVCPWCGEQLPEHLAEELATIIFDELELNGIDDPRMPEEFKTDAWWKKRGL